MKNLGEAQLLLIGNGTDAYSQGDVIGAITKVDVSQNNNSGNSVLLQQLVVIDQDGQGKKIKIVVLAAAVTDPGDNSAFNPTDADMLEIIDVIPVETYTSFTAGKVAIVKNLALTVATGTSRPFYLAVLADEAITFTAANKLAVRPFYYVD